MIDARELRIGNWVDYQMEDGSYKPFRVVSLHVCKPEEKYLEPIKLTPEILEKAGFKEEHTDEKDLFYTLKLTDDVYNPLGIISTLIFDEDCPVCLFPNKAKQDCKHLHQLQNLYFALTNSELEINLP